jgi:nitrate/TMAO reductase-like tetraheme cytochrome c subunit
MKLRDSRTRTFISGRTKVWFIIVGFIVGLIFLKSGKAVVSYTSTDKYCMSCHIHPQADQTWKLSTHFNNASGNVIHCTECHLPPEGHGYLFAKAKHGFKDAYGRKKSCLKMPKDSFMRNHVLNATRTFSQ